MAVKASNQITIVDVTDAYSVILTSEAYTFVGGINGTGTGNTCTTQAVAYCGSTPCTTVTIGNVTCPAGIKADVTNNGTASPTITFTTTATVSAACEATIEVNVEGVVVNKKFSFAVAKTGATGSSGKGITAVTTYYLTTSASTGVTTSTTGWSTTPTATTTDNKYIWSYTKTTYTSGDPTNSTPAIIGTHGATGAQGGTGATGKGVSKVETFYLTTSASTGVTTSTTGWSTTPTATTTDKKYIWSYQKITYTSGDPTYSTPAIVGTHGATGDQGPQGPKGDDPPVMAITTSNGTVFKNSTGTTELIAHVFVGGVEQTITSAGVCGSYGTVKWYKGESPLGAANKISVSASDVKSVQAYTAQLE